MADTNEKGPGIKTKMSFTDFIPSLNFAGAGQFSPLTSAVDFISNPRGLTEILESVDFAITMIKNPVISLFINPQSITVTKNILLNKQQTKGGFVVQFWGPDLETIQVKAETGYFGLSNVPIQSFNLFKDYCFQGRYNTKKPFKSIPIITMLYEGQALRGYFNNLTYNIVQSRPYIMTYDFTFTVVELVSVPIVTSIAKIANKFGGVYNTSDDLKQYVDFSKGWGTKLY
jgi:hypothetical protein